MCNINSNSFISPILNLSNNKLVGIIKSNNKYYNKGILFKYLIKEFRNEYNYSKNVTNEIEILINVEIIDINQKIYFLFNEEEFRNENKENNARNNADLKNLNNLNTELSINNNRLLEFQKYFKPDKKGENNIKLIINKNLTDFSYMFYGCKNIIKINFISFNTKYVSNMEYMFY